MLLCNIASSKHRGSWENTRGASWFPNTTRVFSQLPKSLDEAILHASTSTTWILKKACSTWDLIWTERWCFSIERTQEINPGFCELAVTAPLSPVFSWLPVVSLTYSDSEN